MVAIRGMAASALEQASGHEDDEDLLDWLEAGLLALPAIRRVRRMRVTDEGDAQQLDGIDRSLLAALDRLTGRDPATIIEPIQPIEQTAADGRVVALALALAARGEGVDAVVAQADPEGAGIPAGELLTAAALRDQAALSVAVRRARAEARLDSLTGCLHHGAMHAQLEEEIARARRLSGRLACVMLDLDDFKSVNERHGHPVGDRVLRIVSAAMREECRQYDVCCRYGGDEFLVILPDAGVDEAIQTAERLRAAASGAVVFHEGRRIAVAATAGVADWRQDESAGELLRRADIALMRGKGSGKDSVARA